MSKLCKLLCPFQPDRWILAIVFCAMMLAFGCQRPAVQQASNTEVQKEESRSGRPDQDASPDQTAPPAEEIQGEPASSQAPVQTDEAPVKLSGPIKLFDGKELDFWEEIEFGGEGEISIKEGILNFEMGDPFTGVSSTLEDLPKTNFEVSLEARKTNGVDFFCGLTFPVADSHCTLILGGWGGSECGLSCIDDKDASSNETNSSMNFKKGQWYKIRVRVEPHRIRAWVDDKQIVNANIEGRTISLRGDTALCEPLGIASFQTQAQYRKIELRLIESKEELGK